MSIAELVIEFLSALRYGKKFICNECFNNLPVAERGGRGARPTGWLSGSEEKVDCCKCGRGCYFLEDDAH